MAYLKNLVFLISVCTILKAEKYTTKWDNIDVDEILRSDRLLENYKKCLMDEGKCTAEGKELKKNIPDALQTDCTKCSEKQKVNTEKVIDFLMENKKDWWEELQKKYDPSGIYKQKKMQKAKITKENTTEAQDVNGETPVNK